MEINELLKIAMERLADRDYIDPLFEARLILRHVLDVEEIYIHVHGHEKVSEEDEKRFFDIVDKRATGYPLQYILKEANFMGLDFYVEEGVLIPRSDTEVLVEYLLDYVDGLEEGEVKVLDLGVGSGAIPLSLAHYRKNIRAWAIDIDPKVLSIAEKNRKRFKLDQVKLLEGDLFKGLGDQTLKFDIISSNPPYINRDEIAKLQKEVRDYEPSLALDGGLDGLDFYRRISSEARDYLVEDGLLIFEIGYDQGERVSQLLKEEGYGKIEILKDLQGHDRVVLGFNKEA